METIIKLGGYILTFIIFGIIFSILPWLEFNNSYITISKVPIIIKIIVTIIGIVLLFIAYKFYKKEFSEDIKMSDSHLCSSLLPCFIDEKRKPIVETYHPDMYLPLEYSLVNLISNTSGLISAKNIACKSIVFPFIENEQIEYIPNLGYRFNGKNMLTVHSNYNFPDNKQARTFVMAINPTAKPEKEKPMFFFAYGNRKSHECGDGINNHDKSFGLMWGEPAPDDEIKKDFKGIGVRVFFYCEHCKNDRISDNCDTKVLTKIDQLNQWYIFTVTYDGDEIKLYKDGAVIHSGKYNINTSTTSYLNIGGFVHHDEDGAIVARDTKYSMNGYIREFMMFRKVLNQDEVNKITQDIKLLL